MNPKHLQDNDPWMLGEDIPDADLFFSNLWLHCFVNDFVKHTGREYTKILCKYEGYHLWFYFGEKSSFEVGENIVERIINEDGYGELVNKNIIEQADILSEYSKTIPQENLQDLPNKELWKIYSTHQKLHNDYYTWCWIPVAADMFHNNLTNRVKEYLKSINILDEDLTNYFITLTQPTKKSLIFVEQQELLNIAIEIEKDKELKKKFKETKEVKKLLEKLPKDILKLLLIHKDKYYYTKHLWVKGEYTVEDYVKQLQDILNEKDSVFAIKQKQLDEFEENKKKRAKFLKELNIDKKWQKVFDTFGDFMVTKIYRRYAQLLAVHHMSAILKEIARRNHITEKQVRFMLVDEMEDLLLHNKCDETELLKRAKKCVYYAEKDCDIVLTGEKAEEMLKQIETKVNKDIKELRGEVGCPGFGKGKVKIIIRAEDMEKMNEGDVLVSIATDPDIVPAMKKASAIITEQGGVTSHAAIVSRELGIPCVIGTKVATKVLKDGDKVEVDAGAGIVKKIF